MNARHFLSGVALAGILASPASATSEQWLSRYAPPVNPASSVGKISQSDSAVARPEGEKAKVVIKDLKAVVFVGKPGEVRKRGATGVGVSDKSGVVPAEALAAAGAYLGRAVSLGDLDQITRDLVLAFRTADRPVVNIVVPEQEVSNGVLQVLVVVGRLAHVRVEGASPAPDWIAKEVRLPQNEPISEAALLNDLRYFNRNPFRNVSALYQPGTAYGQTDVVLNVNQPKKWQVYAGTETKGDNGPLGLYRPFAGIMATDLLGLDEVYGYQFSWGKDWSRLRSHVFSVALPLPGRFQLQAMYGRTDSKVALADPLSQTGSSDVAGIYLTAPLPYFGRLSHDLRIGGEYKRTNNDLDFGGTRAVAGEAVIAHAVVGYTGEMLSAWGVTRLDGNVYVSPGRVFANNNDTAFQALRANAKSEYVYARGTLEHRADLWNDWRIAASLTGQAANASLLPSEMLQFGGIGSVRGFLYGKTRADSGVIGNLTLFAPALRLLGESGGFADQLRFYGFIDSGSGWNVSPAASESKSVSLTGAGLGVSYEVAANASLDVGYGWNLGQSGAGSKSNGAYYLRAVVRY